MATLVERWNELNEFVDECVQEIERLKKFILAKKSRMPDISGSPCDVIQVTVMELEKEIERLEEKIEELQDRAIEKAR